LPFLLQSYDLHAVKHFCHAYCCKEISSTCDLVFHFSPLEEDRRTALVVIVIGLHPENVRFKLLINEIFLSACWDSCRAQEPEIRNPHEGRKRLCGWYNDLSQLNYLNKLKEFIDIASLSPFVNRRFVGKYHLHLQGRKSAEKICPVTGG
jgi:hypothetical protein